MHSKSKVMGMLVLLFAVVFALGAVFFGVNGSERASALEDDTAAAETLAAQSAADEAAEEENGGYSVFYFIMDGVTATSLIGIAVSEGWQMALWLSFVYWILAVVASILMVIITKKFFGSEGKPFNIIALLGLIWAFFMPIAGFMLSMFGKRLAATHEGGKLYYIGGIAVSSVFMGIAILLAFIQAGAPFLPF